MFTDKLTRFGEAIQRAKAQAIRLTATPEERCEIMQALLLGDALIDELRARGVSRDTGGAE